MIWRTVVRLAFIALVSAGRVDVGPAQYVNSTHELNENELIRGCVSWSDVSNSFQFHPGREELAGTDGTAAVACGSFSPGCRHRSNFGQLRISTSGDWPDDLQMQAAGHLEGVLTAAHIFDHWYNLKWWMSQQTNDTFKIMDWLTEHYSWVRGQLGAQPSQRQHAGMRCEQAGAATACTPTSTGSSSSTSTGSSPGSSSSAAGEAALWGAVGLVVNQLDGLVSGYNARVSELGPASPIDFITPREFVTLNSIGDVLDLLGALFPKDARLNPRLPDLSPAQIRAHLGMRGHCSALIKVAADLSDLLMGHVSWFSYTSMTRIYKHYDLRLQGGGLPGKKLSFSSYPGLLSSLDDFYLLGQGQGLAMLQTSLATLNASAYSSVVPQSLLSWQRVRAANLLSTNGEEWARIVAMYNSGTYNNQYMVLDLARFAPGQPLQPGLLTVVEQVPALVMWQDATQVLQYGHWPSYNVPFYAETYQRAGYASAAEDLAALGGAYTEAALGLSYQMSPRAQIFRRDAGSVRDLHGLKRVLRSNGYPSDPLSTGSPWSAICSRGDLDQQHPSPGGCYDGKVTSYKLARRMAAEAINGPPAGEDGMPAFSWTGHFAYAAHRGMPAVFDFSWEPQVP